MITRRSMLLGTLASAVLTAASRPAAAAGVHVETGPAFGSAWRLVLASQAEAAAARRAVEAVIGRIDAVMSPFRATSDLFRFNAAASNRPTLTLDVETARVTATALELARASAGAFDPTSAPFGRRIGFGPVSIAPGRPAGCFQDLGLSGRTLTADRTGVTLDLCAIAKGYALDRITAALDGLDFVMELGGEVAARGRHPAGRKWRLGIDRPGSDRLQRVIAAGNNVLATSANVQQGYDVRGHHYGHVVDPRAGGAVDNAVVQVSVLAPNGELADGLATAAFVMGPDAAKPMLRSFDARALFLMRDGSGLREVDVLDFTRETVG